jgi:hypothetical protein
MSITRLAFGVNVTSQLPLWLQILVRFLQLWVSGREPRLEPESAILAAAILCELFVGQYQT